MKKLENIYSSTSGYDPQRFVCDVQGWVSPRQGVRLYCSTGSGVAFPPKKQGGTSGLDDCFDGFIDATSGRDEGRRPKQLILLERKRSRLSTRLAARGYWSLALFLRGVGASPFASCGCRTRNLGTGTGGVLLHVLTSKVVTMLRAYASRVGVFLRDFLSFFSRVAARSRALLFLACTTCVSGRLVAKDFSCGGGRCVCRRRVSAVVACVLARLFSFAKKKPTVDLYRPPSTQCFPCNRKSIRR